MEIQIWHLIIYFIAGLLVILGLNPERVKAKLRRLFTDRKFVEETTRISHEILISKIRLEMESLMDERIGIALSKFSEWLISDYEFKVPDGMYENIIAHFSSWYANLHKKAQAESNKAIEEAKDAVSYMQMNQGNAVAMDAISARLAQRSPILAMVFQQMMASKANGSQGNANQPKGGY